MLMLFHPSGTGRFIRPLTIRQTGGNMRGRLLRRNGMLWTCLVVSFMFALLGAASATADVGTLEVEEYSHDFGVSQGQAEAKLDVQEQGTEAGVVEDLEQRLDGRYAGVWFDNHAGEFVVPLLAATNRAAVAAEFTSAGLGDDFRTTPAQSSW